MNIGVNTSRKAKPTELSVSSAEFTCWELALRGDVRGGQLSTELETGYFWCRQPLLQRGSMEAGQVPSLLQIRLIFLEGELETIWKFSCLYSFKIILN